MRPHELVENPDYFRDVMLNMSTMIGKKENAFVRFGLTGIGVSPNYEIGAIEGPFQSQTFAFDGRSHERFHSPYPFDAANLSESFSYMEVRDMLKRALELQKPTKR